ncbi:MAG: NUDIX hydrolase [Nocardioidaceae bacterium]
MTAAAQRETHALPRWLQPLAEVASSITSRDLSRRVPPPPVTARASAVLMLFGEGAAGPDLLLTERSHDLRAHAGQVAFPGGASDRDDDGPVATALREAMEEVGVDAAGVDVFGLLPALWVPPSNFAVTTVLGWWREPSEVVAVDSAEVAAVLRVPLAHLLEPRNRFTVRHPSGWTGPAFDVGDGLVLWGFTAGVVARLFVSVGWEQPWDAARVRPVPITVQGRAL